MAIWDNIQRNKFNTLDENKQTSTLIIGGGISGIMCAYRLTQLGISVILIEKDELASKITSKTTAQISIYQDTLFSEMIKKIGFNKTKLYVESQQEAIKEYINLASYFSFDLVKLDAIIYSISNQKAITDEIKALNKLNIEYSTKIVNDKTRIIIPNQLVINPIKLINCLSQYLTIYTHTSCTEIKKDRVITNIKKDNQNLYISYQNLIIATHFPIIKNLFFSSRLYQKRSYIYVTKTRKKLNYTLTNIDKYGKYIRPLNESSLIIGLNDINVGCLKNSKLKKITTIDKWFNQDLMTLDSIPYIGRICKNTYVLTGFNMWGFSNSMIGSIIISELINKTNSKYYHLFNPKRIIINKELFKHLFRITKSMFGLNKKRCPHLKGTLIYNNFDRTYDCICHGSSFNSNGEVIFEPSKKDLE